LLGLRGCDDFPYVICGNTRAGQVSGEGACPVCFLVGGTFRRGISCPCLGVVRAIARVYWVGVSPPYDVLLSFERPKETNERKGRPDVSPLSRFPALLARSGFLRRHVPVPTEKCAPSMARPLRAIPPRAALLGETEGFESQTRLAFGIARMACATRTQKPNAGWVGRRRNPTVNSPPITLLNGDLPDM
jgi:hypothetical protein